MHAALSLSGVAKRYAGHLAVHDLSLTIPRGTIYGILGPNGAGKSTTIRMAMGIIARDGGEVRLLGTDPAVDRLVLRRVGYLPEERGLYRKMKVLDVVAFFGTLKGMDTATARREGERWLERMGLAEWRRARVETLSKGMQQKVQFITTVLHGPELLVLDEPASGLDPVNQEVLRATILSARHEGRTVILSTHSMSEAEQLCDSVCIIAEGTKVLDGRLADVRAAHRQNRWAVDVETRTPEAERLFEEGRLRTRPTAAGWEVELDPGDDPRDLLAALSGMEARVIRFERVEPTLHEIFIARVGQGAATPRQREEAYA